jgi:hypothetical protein
MANGKTNLPGRADIERIAREVLAELSARSRQGNQVAPSGGELVVTNKVVSLAQLEGRLGDVTRLVAPRGAVFTPAARDELRKYQVAIASTVDGPINTTNRQSVMLGLAETEYCPASLVNLLSRDGVRIERAPQIGLIGVVDEICEQVAKGGQLGLLMTGQPAAALCLANRQRGVRASLGHNVRATADAVATIAVNLLVVDPAEKSLFELRQIVRTWLRGGRGNCPAAFAERLA